MVKATTSKPDKIMKYIELYPKEFIKSKTGLLLCSLCNTSVTPDRKNFITIYRRTTKHKTKLSNLNISILPEVDARKTFPC